MLSQFKELVFSNSLIYNSFQSCVGYFGISRLNLFSKYLPYTPGMSVLDLGCGPAPYAETFRNVDYLGIDINSKYIEHAKKRLPNYRFLECNFLDLSSSSEFVPSGGFNLIFANGLLHHLDDVTATSFLSKSSEVLSPGGHLVTIDPCIHKDQSALKQRLILSDRGKNVRSIDQMTVLTSSVFDLKATISIEENLLAMPYTHVIVSYKK